MGHWRVTLDNEKLADIFEALGWDVAGLPQRMAVKTGGLEQVAAAM